MNTNIKYLSSNLTKTEANRIYQDLLVLFENDKVYQEKELCLKAVADRLGTNTKYLSQVVNTRTNDNFQVFLNHFRIREFQTRLLNGEARMLTFYGLAQECGFNNRSTFYRAFKEVTGQTPKSYFNLQMAA